MPEDKQTTAPEAPATEPKAVKRAAKKLELEKQIAAHVRMRPTGRRGFAKRRAVPSADATKLSITAHGRCRRRGIKLFGLHFTCDNAIDLEIAKLPPGIVGRICRHPELIVIEFKGKERITPVRVAPKPPKRTTRATQLINPKRKATPSPAGPLSRKRRKLTDEKPKHARVEGKEGAKNHPRPAERRPAERASRRDG